MDAKEFIKAYVRICRSSEFGCATCPLSISNCLRDIVLTDANIDKLVSTVDAWAKEHSKRTRLQDFLEKYPDADIEDDGTPSICAAKLGYRHSCSVHTSCKRCWDEPM